VKDWGKDRKRRLSNLTRDHHFQKFQKTHGNGESWNMDTKMVDISSSARFVRILKSISFFSCAVHFVGGVKSKLTAVLWSTAFYKPSIGTTVQCNSFTTNSSKKFETLTGTRIVTSKWSLGSGCHSPCHFRTVNIGSFRSRE
jgi:hypothetical protein